MIGTPERWIVIPRWDEFQHRDMARSSVPPWIKNATRLLGDDDYLSLSMAQRGILHGLWLLYASHRRVLNENTSRRLLAHNKGESRHFQDNLEALNHAGFISFSASKPARYLASLEVEGEREGEGSLAVDNPRALPNEARPPASQTYAGELAALALDEALTAGELNGKEIDEPYFARLLVVCGDTEENFVKLRRAARGKPPAATVVALEAATAPSARDPLAVALSVLADYGNLPAP